MNHPYEPWIMISIPLNHYSPTVLTIDNHDFLPYYEPQAIDQVASDRVGQTESQTAEFRALWALLAPGMLSARAGWPTTVNLIG